MSNREKKPLISIIINCYNGEKYLRKTLQSILKQTYKNWEIIFFDNNSNDNSVKILENFKDKRIKYYLNKKKNVINLYEARNTAIKKAKGKFITFLDVDDTWKKNKLYEQIKIYNKYPNVKIFYSNFKIFDQQKQKIFKKYNFNLPSGFITQNLLNDYCIGLLTLFINKNIFKKYKFNEKYKVIGDFDLLIKLSLKFEIISVQKVLAFYRIHKSNYSKNIDIYLNEMLDWKKRNIKKLIYKKLNLNNIDLMIFRLRIKLLIFRFYNIFVG